MTLTVSLSGRAFWTVVKLSPVTVRQSSGSGIYPRISRHLKTAAGQTEELNDQFKFDSS